MGRGDVRIRPRALRDIADIAIHLAEEAGSDDLAFHFVEAARATFEELAAMPAMGALRSYRQPALAQVRMWRVSGFSNHLIFYRSAERGIEVIRVLHAKRDIVGMFGGRG